MPAGRNQLVTVRRPLAKRAPSSNRSRRGAERRSRAPVSSVSQADKVAGRCENSMAGSLAGRGTEHTPHRVRGAGSRPPARRSHASLPRQEVYGQEWLLMATMRNSRKVKYGPNQPKLAVTVHRKSLKKRMGVVRRHGQVN